MLPSFGGFNKGIWELKNTQENNLKFMEILEFPSWFIFTPLLVFCSCVNQLYSTLDEPI